MPMEKDAQFFSLTCLARGGKRPHLDVSFAIFCKEVHPCLEEAMPPCGE